jgi:hypothetical protein
LLKKFGYLKNMLYLCNIINQLKNKNMKYTFEKNKFNTNINNDDEKIYIDLGFNPLKIDVCYKNGKTTYTTIKVKVLNEKKMYAENYIFNNECILKIRRSDHFSNLEKICSGVSGNLISFECFKNLIDNKVII